MPLGDIAVRRIVIISDSTGETASRAAKVAAEQFFGVKVIERRFVNVLTAEALEEAMRYAQKHNAYVQYTLVSIEMSEQAAKLATELGIPAVDLLRPSLLVMAQWLGQSPGNIPGHQINDDYLKRVAAQDFAKDFDDGHGLENLDQAEAVILGVSRSSKTPHCQLLGYKSVKAANVPLVLNMQLHPNLFKIDPRRVFVLSIQAERLKSLRSARAPRMGLRANDQYVDMLHIREEIKMVNALLAQNPGWTRIDVTTCPLETTVAIILSHLQARFSNGDAQ